jgi:polygalacturonase
VQCYTGSDPGRPIILHFYQSRDIEVWGLFFLSSPRYSIDFKDCADIIVHDVTIFIDSSVPRGIDRHDSITYALNTDGIDIAAFNVTVYNANITNYDDAIVPKPCQQTGKYCTCAGNIFAYNNYIKYSVGLAIGSVPPNDDVNCIRNVTFKDTTMYRPLKAIYIKSNPGDHGSGIVEDITYENIYIMQALWWTVWIGPQQQNQPGSGSGTGCNFLFPKLTKCATQPLVSISRITLRNVTAVDTIPMFEGPGVILCDEANPCKDIVFDNVVNTMYTGNVSTIFDNLPVEVPRIVFPTRFRTDDWTFDYITKNAFGSIFGAVEPVPCFDNSCFWDGESKN